MTKTVTENIGLRAVRVRKRLATSLQFYACDGTVCVLIEAGSEEDARYLCREVKLDFVGLCQKWRGRSARLAAGDVRKAKHVLRLD